MRITVLIPAYEPDELLLQVVQGLREKDFRIVVVDDGSGPDYADIFSRVTQYAEVLSYPKNRGKGAALKHGMSYIARHEIPCDGFITADADGQHSVTDICRVREQLEKGEGFVLTCRNLKGKNIPFRSRFGNTLSRVVCAFAGSYYLSDNQSGLRGFSAKHLSWLCKISGDKYDYEMNVLLYATRQELPIRCLSIETIYLNNNQSSHFNPVGDTLRIYKRVAWTARISIAMALLHCMLISIVSLTLGWQYSVLSVPACALFVTVLGYFFNRWFVFRNVHYGCGPRIFIITALRTAARYSLCCLFNLLPIPLLPAWLLACLLTIPLEYAYMLLQAIWYDYLATRRVG